MTPAADGASTASTIETRQAPREAAPAQGAPKQLVPVRKVVVAHVPVLLLGIVLTLVTISALATQRPRNMPFGVTGSSPVVTAAESSKFVGYQMSFVNRLYANEHDVMNAINQGTIYGAYIPGKTSDTLLIVPAKSFFAATVIAPAFEQVAKQQGRPLAIQQVKPLPKGKDPTGGVVGLLMLPLLVGGVLTTIIVVKARGKAAERWRVAILMGYSAVAATLTLVIAGPLIGAFAGDRFWPLVPCAVLIEVTVVSVTAALIAILPSLVALVVALGVFVFVGLPVAGQTGVALLPPYWQAIGGAMPPRYGVNLIQNVLYFSSNNITTPIVVLAVFTVISWLILFYLVWLRPRRTPGSQGQGAASGKGGSTGRSGVRIILVSLVVGLVLQCLFATTYISASHNPASHNMPFAVVGSSSLTSAVPKGSLKITSYPSQSAAQTAIDQAKAWGALISGSSTNKLLTVPSISDLAPLTLPVAFAQAAKSQGQKLTVSEYAPKPLAKGDPYGLVLAMLLTPLLLCGYQIATFLRTATGTGVDRYRAAWIIGFAIVLGLVLDLIACVWLKGLPSDKFWIAWAIMSLIAAVAGLLSGVLQGLLGTVGMLLTLLIIILLGKPSDGGANGVPYLPGFWTAVGPYLPPRNAYILLRNTVYFGGHGTAQALIVLLAYFVVFGVILVILDSRRYYARELPVSHEAETAAAVAAAPAGVAV